MQKFYAKDESIKANDLVGKHKKNVKVNESSSSIIESFCSTNS